MTRVGQVLKGWFVLYTLKGTVLKRRSLALLSERQFGYDILYLVLPPGLTKWCVFCCYQIIKGIYVCMPDFQYYFFRILKNFKWFNELLSVLTTCIISGVLLRCQILTRQLLRQMFVRKLMIFSLLFLLSNLKYKFFEDKMSIKLPKWIFLETIFEIWEHQCLFFMFSLLRFIWQTIDDLLIVVVKGLCFSVIRETTGQKTGKSNLCAWGALCIGVVKVNYLTMHHFTFQHFFGPSPNRANLVLCKNSFWFHLRTICF